MQETQVQSLSQEDTPGGRNGNPLQCFLPRESCGQRSLVHYSPLGCKESVSSISIWNKHKWSRATQLAELEMHEWKISRNPWVKSMRFIGCHWDFILGCCCSFAQSCPTLATPWTAACQASLSFTISQSLLKLMSIESRWCHPTILSSVFLVSSAFNLFQHQGLFQGVGSSHRWPKFLSFSFSISPSNEYSRLIPFMIGWSDLLAVQGTLKSLLQQHSSKHQILGAQFSL